MKINRNLLYNRKMENNKYVFSIKWIKHQHVNMYINM